MADNKQPKVVGSKHYTAFMSHIDDLNNKKSDISAILFDKVKEKHKQELVEKCATIYESAIEAIGRLQKELAKLEQPEKVMRQKIIGSDDAYVPVGQWSEERIKQVEKVKATYVTLCELFDKAYEKSTTADFNALEKHLQKCKK